MQAIGHMFKVIWEVLRRSAPFRLALALVVVGLAALVALGVALPATREPQDSPAVGSIAESDTWRAESQMEDQGQGAGGQAESPEEIAYSGQEAEVADVLTGHSWVSGDVTYVFSDATVSSTPKGGSATTHDYRIESAERGPSRQETFEDNGTSSVTSITETSFVLTWDDKSYAATLVESVTDSQRLYVLECSPTGQAYSVASSGSLVVADEPAGLDEALGGHVDELEEALRGWCASHAPSATRATWDGSATRDWVTGLVSVTLTLDDSAATRVTAVLDLSEATFSLAA